MILVENTFFFTAHDTHRVKKCYGKRTRAFITWQTLTKFGLILQTWINLSVAKFRRYTFSIFLWKTAVFWVFTRRVVVIPYRRFGTTYRSHLQRVKNLDSWPLLRGGSLISRILVLLNADTTELKLARFSFILFWKHQKPILPVGSSIIQSWIRLCRLH
jgi:hypothetical protein